MSEEKNVETGSMFPVNQANLDALNAWVGRASKQARRTLEAAGPRMATVAAHMARAATRDTPQR